ncbi:MAG: hypothetical protein ABI432_19460, partial [Flavobacteriales bacterium]
MDTSSERRVEITGSGRSGSVVYREALGSLSFSWEFGGGDVLAIVQVEDAKAWKTQPSWMAGRRAAILRSVADEVIRQKAPNCRAEIDEAAGVIVLREGARTAQPPPMPPKREFSMTNFRSLRTALALVVLVVAVIAGCILWFKNKVLVIDPGKGTPIGLAVRTDTHIAILIESLVPYMPSLHRDASKDRYRISVFLVPLDGSEPH